MPARSIDHSLQVNMTVSSGNVGDVRAPDMVAALDLKTSEQIVILLVSFSGSAQTGLWVDRFDPYYTRQPPDAITPQSVAKQLQLIEHMATAISRLFKVDSVDCLHDQFVFQTQLALRLIIINRRGHPEQFARFIYIHLAFSANEARPPG